MTLARRGRSSAQTPPTTILALLLLSLLLIPTAGAVYYADSIEALGYNATLTGTYIGGTGTGNYLSAASTGGSSNNLYIGNERILTDGDTIGSAGGWTDDGSTVRLTTSGDDVNATTLYIDNSAGEVGIGTSSPVQALQVTGNIQANGHLIAGTGNGFQIQDNGVIKSYGSKFYLDLENSANAFYFRDSANTVRVNIDSSGNLQMDGDLTVSGGDITLGTTNILSGGDTASLNNIDAINSVTENTLESALDHDSITGAGTVDTTSEIQNVGVGGETSGTVGSITLDDNALDDQYLDAAGDTGMTYLTDGATRTSSYWTGSADIAIEGFIYTDAILHTGETGGGPAGITFGSGNTEANDQISLITGGATRIHIDSNGNVDLNNNQLQTVGSIDATTENTLESALDHDSITGAGTVDTTSEIQNVGVGGETSGTIGSITLDDNALDDQYVQQDGDSMTGALDISDISGGPMLRLHGGDSGYAGLSIDIDDDSSNNPYSLRIRHEDGSAWDAASTAFIVTPDENDHRVGIGTDSPSATLEVAGEARLSSASDMGTANESLATKKYVDDFMLNLQRIHLKKTTGESIVQGEANEIDVGWDVEEYKDDAVYNHNTSSDNDNITVQSSGLYRIIANVMYENSVSSARNTPITYVKVNGQTIDSTKSADYDRGASYGKYSSNTVSTLLDLNAGDTIQIGTYAHNEDGTLTITPTDSELLIFRLSTEAVSDTTLTTEEVQDISGAMTSGNTETGITVTYQDTDGTIDFVTDDTSSSNELQNIWETISSDSGSTTADSQTDTLTITGSGIASTSVSGDTLTITATENDGSTSNEIQNLNSVLGQGDSANDRHIHDLRELELKDWDDDSGGSDASVRLLRRDGNWMFYNGGFVVGSYANNALGDIGDGNLLTEGNVHITGNNLYDGTGTNNFFEVSCTDDQTITDLSSTGTATCTAIDNVDRLDTLHASSFVRSDANDNVAGHTEWQDGYQVRLGTNADFRMWNNNGHTYFRSYRNGNQWRLEGENASGTNRALIYADPDSWTRLYYAGGLKAETTSYGLNINVDDSSDDDGLRLDGNAAITADPSDEWLRLNNANDFTNGIYTPGSMRADGGLYFSGSRYLDDPTGDYGTVQVNGGGANGWEGYSINGRFVFMSDDSNRVGIYDDTENNWVWHFEDDTRLRLYAPDGTGYVELDNGANLEMLNHNIESANTINTNTIQNDDGGTLSVNDALDATGTITAQNGYETGNSGGDSGLTGTYSYRFGYQEGGSWTSPYPDLVLGYHTGVQIGGYKNYGGTRFFNDHPSRSGATEIMSVGDGDDNVDIANDLDVQGNDLTLGSTTVQGGDLSLLTDGTITLGSETSGDLALADGGTGASLSDPNADRILFWDDSDGATQWLEAGSGLSISGNTISSSGTDEKVGVDSAATPSYIGSGSTGGVIRTTSELSYGDGGNYITLGVANDAIDGTELADTINLDTATTIDRNGNQLRIQRTGAGEILNLHASGEAEWSINGLSGNSLKLRATTQSDNVLVLQGDGDVGVGTASPATKLEVNGAIEYQDKAWIRFTRGIVDYTSSTATRDSQCSTEFGNNYEAARVNDVGAYWGSTVNTNHVFLPYSGSSHYLFDTGVSITSNFQTGSYPVACIHKYAPVRFTRNLVSYTSSTATRDSQCSTEFGNNYEAARVNNLAVYWGGASNSKTFLPYTGSNHYYWGGSATLTSGFSTGSFQVACIHK